MGMAFADRRVAHKWIFFPVFHNLIRQSHRGKAENFVARSFLLALVWSALEMFFQFCVMMYKHMLLPYPQCRCC